MPLKMFWAFDPFEEDEKPHEIGQAILKSIAKLSDQVSAVYVSSPMEVPLATAFDVPIGLRFSTYPKGEVESKLKSLGLKGIPATVIENPRTSLTDSVRTLADHVRMKRGDLILVSSHARTGMPRMVLGSFAESLIHFARTDVLLYQLKTKIPTRPPSRLLYAHDFSRRGGLGLERAIFYAKYWGADLDIVHLPQLSYGIKFEGQDPKVEAYRRSVKATAKRIEKQMAKVGIKSSITIVKDWEPPVDLFLKLARKRRSDMILTTAQSGRFAALIGGSVTRGIARRSTIPTLVLKV